MKWSLWVSIAIGIALLMMLRLFGLRTPTSDAAQPEHSLQNTTEVSYSEFIISNNTTTNAHPIAAYNTDKDEFLVVWKSQQGSSYDVRGQRVSNHGTLIGQNFTVSVAMPASGLPDTPAVAYNSNSKDFLVVWSDQTTNLHGQRVLSDGLLIGASFTISTPLNGNPHNPALLYVPAHDRFLITWRGCVPNQQAIAFMSGNGSCYFYTQLVNGTGGWITDNITATASTFLQGDSAIAYIPGRDEFWVVWTEQTKIVAQRILTTGLLSDNPFTITQGTAEMLNPAISSISNQGEFMVVWSDTRNWSPQIASPLGGGYPSIYAQYVLSNGARIGDDFRVSNSMTAFEPKVAYLSERGQHVVVWNDIDYQNHDENVHARWISESGGPIGNDFPVAATTSLQTNPTVIGYNLAFILWEQSRDSADIRGRFLPMPSWTYLPLLARGVQ